MWFAVLGGKAVHGNTELFGRLLIEILSAGMVIATGIENFSPTLLFDHLLNDPNRIMLMNQVYW